MASQSALQKQMSRPKHAQGMIKWRDTQRKGVEEVENAGRKISAEAIRVLALARAAKGWASPSTTLRVAPVVQWVIWHFNKKKRCVTEACQDICNAMCNVNSNITYPRETQIQRGKKSSHWESNPGLQIQSLLSSLGPVARGALPLCL